MVPKFRWVSITPFGDPVVPLNFQHVIRIFIVFLHLKLVEHRTLTSMRAEVRFFAQLFFLSKQVSRVMTRRTWNRVGWQHLRWCRPWPSVYLGGLGLWRPSAMWRIPRAASTLFLSLLLQLFSAKKDSTMETWLFTLEQRKHTSNYVIMMDLSSVRHNDIMPNCFAISLQFDPFLLPPLSLSLRLTKRFRNVDIALTFYVSTNSMYILFFNSNSRRKPLVLTVQMCISRNCVLFFWRQNGARRKKQKNSREAGFFFVVGYKQLNSWNFCRFQSTSYGIELAFTCCRFRAALRTFWKCGRSVRIKVHPESWNCCCSSSQQ